MKQFLKVILLKAIFSLVLTTCFYIATEKLKLNAYDVFFIFCVVLIPIPKGKFQIVKI